MTASGSETRLDDLKPTYQAFRTQHPGMKYVGVWLKKLRLHKYNYIFENYTFEQMMDITDEMLEKMGITQGARTKLVNSIVKLNERYIRLTQAEQELKNGEMEIAAAIQLLHELVETPMKPINIYDTADVAAEFLKLLKVGKWRFLRWLLETLVIDEIFNKFIWISISQFVKEWTASKSNQKMRIQ